MGRFFSQKNGATRIFEFGYLTIGGGHLGKMNPIWRLHIFPMGWWKTTKELSLLDFDTMFRGVDPETWTCWTMHVLLGYPTPPKTNGWIPKMMVWKMDTSCWIRQFLVSMLIFWGVFWKVMLVSRSVLLRNIISKKMIRSTASSWEFFLSSIFWLESQN